MATKALFPGSFDPFHNGHEDLVTRALGLFDEIVIGLGENSSKSSLFDLDTRVRSIQAVFANQPKVSVTTYNGLTVEYADSINAGYIVRGLRNVADYQYEQSIAQMNRAMKNSIETIFILTSPEFSAINSTILRDIVRHEGDISKFVPPAIQIK